MTVPSNILDPRTKMAARVTEFGAQAVAPLQYSTVYSVKMDTINTAYTLVEPRGHSSIIITDIVMTGSRNVGVNGSLVEVYSSDTDGSLDASEGVFSSEVAKNSSLVLNSLNFIIPEGKFLLAKMDDADIYMAIGYYYVPIE